MNLYGYVLGNSIKFKDITGFTEKCTKDETNPNPIIPVAEAAPVPQVDSQDLPPLVKPPITLPNGLVVPDEGIPDTGIPVHGPFDGLGEARRKASVPLLSYPVPSPKIDPKMNTEFIPNTKPREY